MRCVLLLCVCATGCGAASHPSASDVELRFELVTMGRPAGSMTVQRAGAVERVRYEEHDRGRGAQLDERAVFEAGRLASLSIAGVDYYKAPVDEQFRDDGTTMSWQSASERGAAASSPAVAYDPINGTAEDTARMVRQALAGSGTIAIAPAGVATVTEIERLTVHAGDRSREVALYAVAGLGLRPSYLWLDGDDELFAAVGSWGGTIREGWAETVDALFARQQADAVQRRRRLATLAVAPDGPLVFRDVAVVDVVAGERHEHQTVVVRGDTIDAVGAVDRVPVPAGATVIDGRGDTLVPGLWDLHVHVGEDDGPLLLAAGITTARDLGNDVDTVVGIRDRWASGETLGPDLLLAGLIDGPGPYTGPTKAIVESADDGERWIDRFVQDGYVGLKIYSSIAPALVAPLAKLAHARGLRVSGHVPQGMIAEEAVVAGFDEVQHANFLLLDLLADQVSDTRTPERFTAIGEHGGELDLSGPAAQHLLDVLVAHHTVVDPTLAAFEPMFLARPGEVAPTYAAVLDRFPPSVQRGFRTGGLPVADAAQDARYRAGFAKMVELVGQLRARHIPIVAGEDDLAGFTLHRELELYVAAGYTPIEALQIATVNAARILGRDAQVGAIAPGLRADLVLVVGDPTTDIAAIRNTALTVRRGVAYAPRALYAAASIAHPIASPLPVE